MYIFLIILIALIAVVLSFAVLLQSGKGGGLAGIAAGGQATQILGARQAPDFLEKATWTLGTAFIVLCVVANFFADPTEARESVLQGQTTAPAAPESVLPGTVDGAPPAAPAPAPDAE